MLCKDVDDVLVKFSEENKAHIVIHTLVEFLLDDFYWFKINVSEIDKEMLKEAVSKI